MVLAAASWVLFFICPGVLAIAALFLAAQADKRIKDSGYQLKGSGLVSAARITAWSNLAVISLVVVIWFGILGSSR